MKPIFSPSKILDSLILMGIVKEGSLHGYALASLIEEKFGWKPSQTAVYNSLKSMENDKLVTSEEKIEKGRVQKIYSITDKGRSVFDETHQHMREHMDKNFSQFFSFMQMVGDSEYSEVSDAYQQKVQSIMDDMKSIFKVTLFLLHKAPEDTQKIIESTLASLKKVAEKKGIKIPEEELCE
ncbi:MAG: helix-turn-helix transcriptional regulator [Candidatus Heimdallarchaeota archaeon]|nr:helix-turn-helix transcriptional regulator [Candidatus Heimdallarchaeota archaeon]